MKHYVVELRGERGALSWDGWEWSRTSVFGWTAAEEHRSLDTAAKAARVLRGNGHVVRIMRQEWSRVPQKDWPT